MKRFGIVLLLLTLFVSGCRRRPAEQATLEPLTVEDWKVMPAEEKFEWTTMERLKLGNAKFQDDGQWDHFARTVFIPARKREMPDMDKKK